MSDAYTILEKSLCMAIYVNPDNSLFHDIVHSPIYIDKTELLHFTDSCINTTSRFVCNSRPRRFGKSITADMLCAWYSKGCNSKDLFSDLKISAYTEDQKYRNSFHVIHLDMLNMVDRCVQPENIIPFIETSVIQELRQEYRDVDLSSCTRLNICLSLISQKLNERFIIIIDEWDMIIRDPMFSEYTKDQYISFLRGLFKGQEANQSIALAYLTGILPIRKTLAQSSLNNFEEYTMISAAPISRFIGFTEEEVADLCAVHHMDYTQIRSWYDGYRLDGHHLYNPRAVIAALTRGVFQSYWTSTNSYETVKEYIEQDFDGLKEAVIEMLAGNSIHIRTSTFQNDLSSLKNKDDVLTLLVHLGYLAYDFQTKTVSIPNEEIRLEFEDAVSESYWSRLNEFEDESEQILNAVINRDEKTVAEK